MISEMPSGNRSCDSCERYSDFLSPNAFSSCPVPSVPLAGQCTRRLVLLHQWNFACTPPYLTPSTLSSNTSPALSIRMSRVKSRLSNSTPLVVVNLVNNDFGTVFKSVVSVQTLIRPLRKESGAVSVSQAMRSSSTIRDWPGRKLRV